VRFAPNGPPIRAMPNAVMHDSLSAIVTFPVSVWYPGRRTYDAILDFGKRPITEVLFDPGCRFPDRNPADNVWPRSAVAATGLPGSPSSTLCSR